MPSSSSLVLGGLLCLSSRSQASLSFLLRCQGGCLTSLSCLQLLLRLCRFPEVFGMQAKRYRQSYPSKKRDGTCVCMRLCLM